MIVLAWNKQQVKFEWDIFVHHPFQLLLGHMNQIDWNCYLIYTVTGGLNHGYIWNDMKLFDKCDCSVEILIITNMAG
jgi:hypothetical protein